MIFKAEKAAFDLKCDALAVDPRSREQLALVSLVGSQTAMKAARAVLAQPKVWFEIAFPGGSPSPEWYLRSIGGAQRDESGYTFATHHVGYNVWQLIIITKRKSVMASMDEESVWQRLRSSEYTTPIMRHWMPWVMRRLVADKHLHEAKCWQCGVGVLSIGQNDFDAMICSGLKNRDIIIN